MVFKGGAFICRTMKLRLCNSHVPAGSKAGEKSNQPQLKATIRKMPQCGATPDSAVQYSLLAKSFVDLNILPIQSRTPFRSGNG